jgi:uncharacterized protein YjbI with pentapeptide repeats
MYTKSELIRKLRNPDNKVVLQAVEELRARGWLEDGSLEKAALRHVHLQHADLYRADLCEVNLSMADLRWTDLSGADLQGALLCKSDLYQADFSDANLSGANLCRANLQGARNLTETQLANAFRLRGAILPDGSRYDGRYHLAGDLESACSQGVDISDSAALARFYDVIDALCQARRHVQATGLENQNDLNLIRKLRSSENELAVRAVEELRRRGRLSDGTLAWVQLRFVHWQGADLSTANLRQADLAMADLRAASLAYAHLDGTRFDRVDLSTVDLDQASLRGALLRGANLQGASNVTNEQLMQAHSLRGATLPDGSRYDGRFSLAGDLEAARAQRFDLADPAGMAAFYGVSIEAYCAGQNWLRCSYAEVWNEDSHNDAESLLPRLYEKTNRHADPLAIRLPIEK